MTAEHYQAELENMERALNILNAKADAAKKNASDLGHIGIKVADSFASGMATAFDGIIQGTVSVKDAFKSMGLSVLRVLSKVIAEMLAAKVIMASLDLISGLKATKTPTKTKVDLSKLEPGEGFARYGGIFEPYAGGGIARGRDAGYPAILHGTEAVVPLPNGNSIPVEMQGNAQGTNNVTVNVSMDGQGRSEESAQGDQQMRAMGIAISAAVQDELQRQKRPGGILSPYGAA